VVPEFLDQVDAFPTTFIIIRDVPSKFAGLGKKVFADAIMNSFF